MIYDHLRTNTKGHFVLTLFLGVTHVVIWVSMKMRIKTSRAGKQQANIIQMGNSVSKPRGLMIQPLLSGLVTENPLGTLSFWAKDIRRRSAAGAFEITDTRGIRSTKAHLCVRVFQAIIHQNHDEDCNGYSEVSNNSAELDKTI